MNGTQRKLIGAIGYGVVLGVVVFGLGVLLSHGWEQSFEQGLYAGLGAAFGYSVGWRDCLGNVAVQMKRLRGELGG